MTEPRRPISVIVTVLNEGDNVRELLEALLAQPLDELIVCDAGSTDDTLPLLYEGARANPQLRIIHQTGNRSTGRNAAISAARNDWIACTDGGCVPCRDWLEKLTKPFDDGAEFVAGFYEPLGPTSKSTCIGLVMVMTEGEAEASDFLPSARSMAFHRDVWKKVGGFPEDTDFAEDTVFAQRVVDSGIAVDKALEARVRWRPPPNFRGLSRASYRWGHGDGLLRLRGFIYKRLVIVYFGLLALAAIAGLWNPLAAIAFILTISVDATRRLRPKIPHIPLPEGLLWLPLAHLVSTYASTLGFAVGTVKRYLRSKTSRSEAS